MKSHLSILLFLTALSCQQRADTPKKQIDTLSVPHFIKQNLGYTHSSPTSIIGKWSNWVYGWSAFLEIKENGTFEYNCRTCYTYSFTQGTWELIGHTLVLNSYPIYKNLQHIKDSIRAATPPAFRVHFKKVDFPEPLDTAITEEVVPDSALNSTNDTGIVLNTDHIFAQFPPFDFERFASSIFIETLPGPDNNDTIFPYFNATRYILMGNQLIFPDKLSNPSFSDILKREE